MAIKIEHGGGKTGSAPGSIIASGLQAGMQRHQQDKQLVAQMLQQLSAAGAARRSGGGGGGSRGGGGGGRGSGDDALTRMGFENELRKQAGEQKFAQEMELKQEEARLDSRNWDYKYSQESKRKLARINSSKQEVAASDRYSQAEKEQIYGKLDAMQWGITKDSVPADEGKYKGDPAQGPGMSWTDEVSGAQYRRGDTGQIELLQKYKEGPEYHKLEIAAKLEQAEQARAQALDDNEDKVAYDRWEATMEMVAGLKKTEPGQMFAAKDGKPAVRGPSEQVDYGPDDIIAAMKAFGMSIEPPLSRRQQQQIEQQLIEQQQQAAQRQQAEAEFDAYVDQLPVGAEYIAPDGSRRKKKKPLREFPPNPFAAGRILQ